MVGGDGKDGKVSDETLNAYNKEHGTDYEDSDKLIGNVMADETQKMLDASQEMKDLLAESGYDEETINKILEEARDGNRARLETMLNSVSDFMGQDLDAAGAELDEMFASTATNLGELQSMLEKGEISLEAYNK
jgi:ABC-type phosphate transport system auxiliary subunit